MKKPVKVLLWIVGILAVLVVLLIASLPVLLGPTVRTVATNVVPQLTGCEFKMESCSINPFSGKVRIAGFALKNPKGYDEPDAVSFESLGVDLDVASLATKKIHVYDISLEKPFVSYVFDKEGTNNFDRILAAVQSKMAKGEKPEAKKDETKKDEGEAPKVLIDRISINGTKVKYRMITLPIPVPTLTKIGYGKDDEKPEEAKGASLDEAANQVWGSVKDKFTSVGGALGNAAGAVTDGAANALKGAANLVGVGEGSAVGNAAAKTTEAAAEAAKKTTEAAAAVATKTADAAKETAAKAADTAAKAAEATTDAVKDGAKAVGEGLKKLNPFGK